MDALFDPIRGAVMAHPRLWDIRRALGVEGDLGLIQVAIPAVEEALASNEAGLLEAHLDKQEQDAFQEITHLKRRREWLSGQIAAKAAIRMLLGWRVQASHARIERDPDGSPRVHLGAELRHDLHVSISHSGEVALALAARTPGFGIDVETAVDSVLEVVEAFATEAQLETLAASGLRDRSLAAMILWAVKESCLKALRWVQGGMKEVRLQQASTEDGYAICRLLGPGTTRLNAVAFHDKGRAYAVAIAHSAIPPI